MNRVAKSAALFWVLIAGPGFGEVLDCVIVPQSTVAVSAKNEGLVSKVLVERGHVVSKGTPLLMLDDQIERLQLELATANATGDAALRSAEVRLEFRQKELARAQRLADLNVTSASVLDDALIEVTLSQLSIDEARENMERAQIEQKLVAAQLERRTLTAPLDGVIVSLDVAPGEYASSQRELLQIASIDPLYVEVFMPATYFGKVALGETYVVRPMEPLEGEYQATVSVVDQVFDAASGTFGMRLVLENPDHLIPAGIRCTLEVTTG